MEVVVGALVGSITQIVIDKLSSIPNYQFGDSCEKLKGDFTRINAILHDAGMQQINSAVVKLWLKKLEKVAFEADNALDEFNYHLLRKSIFSPSFFYDPRLILGRKIKNINKKLDSIIREATDCGIHQLLIGGTVHALGVGSSASASLETDSFTVDPIFIGRDDDVLKIVEMLVAPTEEAVFILPIVGMGGLGKTALARKVFNHEIIKTHFGVHIWVHVSRDFDTAALLKKILRNVNGGNVADESREGLLKKLQEALKDRTYLLVLDDDWNEEPRKWEDFMNSWLGITCTQGNGIIVTTRSTEVGAIVKTHDMHLLNGLSDEECWSIIKDRVFEGGAITQNLEDIGRSIAKRCQGLPLAANVVGGVLRSKPHDEWLSIKENWVSDVGGDENDISRILKLSFHQLPSPSLKKCFAYCSIFPKGAQIQCKQLIELWMAEGFLLPSQTSDMETVGNRFLHVLLQNSLLQVVDRDKYGEVKHCSMHDLVHDVAASISDGMYYKRDESGQIPKEQAKWYICWGCNGDNKSSRIQKVEAKWLRTLIYNGRVCDIVFSDFKSLHSLTLTDSKVKKLSDSISELIHLRYLNISCFWIRYLPKSIGKLSNLQTIRADLKLPSTLKHLFNLRHLYFSGYRELPPQLGMLISLQTLPYFTVRDKEGHRIGELESLKHLKGELTIYNLENVQGEEESKKACLFQKSGIVRLRLWWGERRSGEIINDENVLKGLQPHPNLKILEIGEYEGASFPPWTLKMVVCLEGCWVGLNNLMEVRLERCSECEEIPSLGHLPHLKSLYLSSLANVKSLGSSFYGVEECSSDNGVYKETISVFPALERLQLWNMPKLREWEEIKIPSGAQMKVFPCLEYLSIRECYQLRSAPSQFTSLKELDIKNMDSGLPLARICGIKLKTLTKLQISFIRGPISLPDWLFHNNQHLSMLSIFHCPELREFPDGLHSLNSMVELKVEQCYLESIPFPVSGGKLQGLTSLRKLSIEGGESFLGELGESCAPLLEELTIAAFHSDGWDSVSFNKVVDWILRFRSHSLRRLHLSGKEDWVSLPDQLQHLTALSSLHLRSFGMEELPEWLGNLSTLQELKLSCCSKLKHLPSVEAMQRLTNLKRLKIRWCPLLEETCRQQSDSDGDSV